MELDINWLHKERKGGRRSGRTTEMLTNVVGIAQLSHNVTHVMVVCTDASSMCRSFIDVLVAVDPSAKYSRTICRGYPSFAVISEYGEVCYVMFSERNVSHWANGLRDAYQVVDHHYVEKQCDIVAERVIDWATNGQTRRIGKGHFRGYGIY